MSNCVSPAGAGIAVGVRSFMASPPNPVFRQYATAVRRPAIAAAPPKRPRYPPYPQASSRERRRPRPGYNGRAQGDHQWPTERPRRSTPNPHALPHNIEAEQALLGALLVNNDVYDRVAAIVQAAHFFDPVHARIFEVAAERIRRNALATPVTIKAFFEDDAGLRELGGPAYLVRLAGAAISLFAARDYAQLVYDLAIRRELILLGQDISEKAARIELDSEPKDQIVEAEQALYQLGEQGKVDRGFQTFRRAVIDAVKVANAAYERDGGLAGLSTGLVDLDKRLGGLHPSDLLILAGRPSMGKTSLATNIAFNIARAYSKGTQARRHRGRRRGRRRRLLLARDVGRAARRPHPLRGLARALAPDPPRRHDRGGDAPLHRGGEGARELPALHRRHPGAADLHHRRPRPAAEAPARPRRRSSSTTCSSPAPPPPAPRAACRRSPRSPRA